VEEQKLPPRFERGTDGPKVIVAGLDGSDSSWRASAYASGLARRQNALLALVYVQPYMAGGAALGVPVSEADTGMAEQLLTEIRTAVERVKDTFQVRWEFHTFRGAGRGRGRGGCLGACGPPLCGLGRGAPGEGRPLAGDGGAVTPRRTRPAGGGRSVEVRCVSAGACRMSVGPVARCCAAGPTGLDTPAFRAG